MWCPRLDHFVRLCADGSVRRCCHMLPDAPRYSNLEKMETSNWLAEVKNKFINNEWPSECIRCKEVEEIGIDSPRMQAIRFNEIQTHRNYLIADVLLDNICNSACQFCSAMLSTKIGSLITKDYLITDNTKEFLELPIDRIIQLDLSGGEPSASKNCSAILRNLPTTVKSVRINTNCSLVMPEIQQLINNGIDVILTVSFDGIGKVHDYVRWPIPWDKFIKNLMVYKEMQGLSINLWTTVNALNVGDFDNIVEFTKQHDFDHAFSFIKHPTELDIQFTNTLTLAAKQKIQDKQIAGMLATNKDNQAELDAFISKQDSLRNINVKNYL